MVANRLRDAAAVLEVDSAYRRDAAIMREAADEVDRLRHDIERHVEIACELATECERLRAELAEAQTVKESLIVALDLFGRHSPKGKPCPVCEAIDAAMAGGAK
jgi:DNA repair exonuclease SbcCD ATPase subunit